MTERGLAKMVAQTYMRKNGKPSGPLVVEHFKDLIVSNTSFPKKDSISIMLLGEGHLPRLEKPDMPEDLKTPEKKSANAPTVLPGSVKVIRPVIMDVK